MESPLRFKSVSLSPFKSVSTSPSKRRRSVLLDRSVNIQNTTEGSVSSCSSKSGSPQKRTVDFWGTNSSNVSPLRRKLNFSGPSRSCTPSPRKMTTPLQRFTFFEESDDVRQDVIRDQRKLQQLHFHDNKENFNNDSVPNKKLPLRSTVLQEISLDSDGEPSVTPAADDE
ncbi:uncharacterized protein KNAG_0E00990 [Huiozyma naganishii CBS 8797]|uniref:Uncharacterized protein n=1 Tax=Huiozyma naganishii (strain ATCC MYA-139 / BCRC 22969 / CBS 8797 / KCTC 17520 / NBRC 10181 / NCYC 3082 / Yp74L-3) TaxID=1071383 RepID=J7RYV1_HUIN7|nr:hypothetical protein KNAG_0E00990 [Kazachstania naganishii CBS 8797]CCK70367.1 hypothetical protein KNAG_0E00990 [Kazachstania naganishii CBS 8797]